MDQREQRGLIIAALCRLSRRNGLWFVPSQTSPEKRYAVDVDRKTCTCPDHQETGFVCKHIHAVTFTLKRELNQDGTVTETKSITFTQKKVYRQNWPAYNEAQTTEKHRFQELLFDLCRRVPEPPPPKTGRHPVPMADRLFAVAYKVYSTFSSRRFACDLGDAHGNGYMTRPLHPNKVNTFLESAELTSPLQSMIARSSLPLRAVETQFAVDSSGLSSSRNVRWYDEKYGVQKSGKDWVKLHIACGVRTNIVTAAAITGRDVNDSPLLPGLLSKTADTFRMEEVSADKGYLSAENVDAIAAHGAAPFIAPKSNTTGGIGGLFEKMFHFYQFRQDEFMQHYHKRSNIESTFSMIKRKFGDAVRSRTDTAMANEALCKVLCHNLCVVIQSQCELGIEATFWDADVEKAVILSLKQNAVQ